MRATEIKNGWQPDVKAERHRHASLQHFWNSQALHVTFPKKPAFWMKIICCCIKYRQTYIWWNWNWIHISRRNFNCCTFKSRKCYVYRVKNKKFFRVKQVRAIPTNMHGTRQLTKYAHIDILSHAVVSKPCERFVRLSSPKLLNAWKVTYFIQLSLKWVISTQA